jgi:chitin-binding protein
VASSRPPQDGRIASAGHDFAAILDETGCDWKKHQVSSGQDLEITWSYHAPHKTRRWNYFLTQADWDPSQPLARDQFEQQPVHTVQLSGQPFWAADDLLPPNPTTHTVRLPRRLPGHQVLLAVWEVADTGNAIYQVIDLDFT